MTYEAPQNDTISLLVASSKYAVVAGGVEVRSGDLVFHHRIDSGFQIITWSNHGLAYALVSRAAGSAPAPVSCAIKAWRIEILSGPDYDSVTVPAGSPRPSLALLCKHDRVPEPVILRGFPEVQPVTVEESSARSFERALPRRDITVPIGHFRTPAIS